MSGPEMCICGIDICCLFTCLLLVSTGSKLLPSERVVAVEKKEKRVSAEENDKPQKPRE